jgi:fatty-acyl-CoA synthase
MVAQCREKDVEQRAELIKRLQGLIRTEVGVDCYIELVPLHTLPRTSSGKLSRSKARLNYIEAHRMEQDGGQQTGEAAAVLLQQAG